MRRERRKTTPRVKGGVVQRKNRHLPTPSYYNTPQQIPVIDRERPGSGYRHLLRKRDIQRFISILPDWPTLSEGLNAIVLAPGDYDTDGWCERGIIGVCAWERELWRCVHPDSYAEHKDLLERLCVPVERQQDGYVTCKFTESTARAYQLLHILLHELGHHRDRMTTRSQREASRGESFAESYARQYEQVIWDRYLHHFSID